MQAVAEIETVNLLFRLLFLGVEKVVASETTTKNPHPIDIAGEKPPRASLTSLTLRTCASEVREARG